jgi:hypothetical protein
LKGTIGDLDGVERVVTADGPNVLPLKPDGAARLNTLSNVTVTGSLDGMTLTQDRLTAVQGRLANPRRDNQIVMTASAAHILGVHVGQIVPLGVYTNAQVNSPSFGTRNSSRN